MLIAWGERVKSRMTRRIVNSLSGHAAGNVKNTGEEKSVYYA